MIHAFSRTEMLIGKAALDKLKNSRVAVFGIGGVGSFAVEGLARAGIGSFILVDHDHICLTNINRQIHALHSTVGRPKVEVMAERILAINPEAEVETHQCFYLPGAGDELIRTDYDYILDAVDTVTAKIDLVVKAQEKGVPIISSMGAGNKLDPTKFEIADIYATSVCPLAKVMRKELRQRGVTALKVVYSREEPVRPGNDADGSATDCSCYHACSPEATGKCTAVTRRQIPGSISFVPEVAGLLMAGEVVKDLLGEAGKGKRE